MKEKYIGEEQIIKAVFMLGMFFSETPYLFQQFSFINRMRGLSSLFFLAVCFFLIVEKKMYRDKIIVIWLFIYLWMNAITFLNSSVIQSRLDIAIFLTSLIFSGYMCRFDKEFYLSFMTYYYTALIVINTLLWRPGGTFVNANGQLSFFIGTKTSITYFQLAACLFSFVYLKNSLNKKRGAICFALVVASVVIYNILQPISTSKMCLAVFMAFVIWDAINPKLCGRILDFVFWIIIAINIGVVFFGVQNYFEYLLVDVLEEDLTLDGRTYIWAVVLSNIINKPIFGHGLSSGVVFPVGLTTLYNTSAHNQLLSWVFYFGIVGLVLMLLFAFWVMTRYKIQDEKGRIARIIFISLATMWITEQWYTYMMYINITVLAVNLHLYRISEYDQGYKKYFYLGQGE